MHKLEKYRDGKLPLNKSQIDNIANEQNHVGRAAQNTAEIIRRVLNESKQTTS